MKSSKTGTKRVPSPRKVCIGEGIFLRPSEEEADCIWEAVRVAGYPENGAGVLQLLLFLLQGDEDYFKSPIFRYLKAHPEHVQAMAKTAGTLAQKAFARLIK